MKINALLFLWLTFSVTAMAQNNDYYMSKTIQVPFEEATLKVKEALKTQGFGIVSEQDMDKMLHEKLGNINMKPYRVLGACNAKIAHQVIQLEDNIALFLPCKVIVKYVDEYSTEVVFVNPETAMEVVKNKEAKRILSTVTDLLKKAMADI
jgi:uncharacterized protein (DUF302 family)